MKFSFVSFTLFVLLFGCSQPSDTVKSNQTYSENRIDTPVRQSSGIYYTYKETYTDPNTGITYYHVDPSVVRITPDMKFDTDPDVDNFTTVTPVQRDESDYTLVPNQPVTTQPSVNQYVNDYFESIVPLLVQESGDYDNYWMLLSSRDAATYMANGSDHAFKEKFYRSVKNVEEFLRRTNGENRFPEVRELNTLISMLLAEHKNAVNWMDDGIRDYGNQMTMSQAVNNHNQSVNSIDKIGGKMGEIGRKYGLTN